MSEAKADVARLYRYLNVDGDESALEAHLLASSKLPGPRANLGLAAAFPDRVSSIVTLLG